MLAQTAVDFAELLDMLLRGDKLHTCRNYLHMHTKLLAKLIKIVDEYFLRLLRTKMLKYQVKLSVSTQVLDHM